MQKNLNLKIKFRESFRPFAPSILREDLKDWFELDCDSPYMLLVANVKKNIQIKETERDKKPVWNRAIKFEKIFHSSCYSC